MLLHPEVKTETAATILNLDYLYLRLWLKIDLSALARPSAPTRNIRPTDFSIFKWRLCKGENMVALIDYPCSFISYSELNQKTLSLFPKKIDSFQWCPTKKFGQKATTFLFCFYVFDVKY